MWIQFIDHASGYMRINHQVYLNNTEIIKVKLTFEGRDQSQIVVIKVYHNDNGIFNASECMEDFLENQKKESFSGTGTSHQHGAEECAIKAVVTMSSTMFVHNAVRCSDDTFSTNSWPI